VPALVSGSVDPLPVTASPLVVGTDPSEPPGPPSLGLLPTESVAFVVMPVVVPVALEPPESPHATTPRARDARTCKDVARG